MAPVSLKAEPQEVVVLGDDLPGRAGEVDLEDGHVAAQVVDMEHQIVGQLGVVPPDHPADAERASPNLCPEVLIDLTRGSRKSNTTSGAQNGARKAPPAPST